MTFSKDFINDKRGDLYPVISKDDDCIEWIENNRYYVQNGMVERMFTRFFPFATYEISFSNLTGECGFVFHLADQKAELICRSDAILFLDGENKQEQKMCEQLSCATMVVSSRPKAFDVYFMQNDKLTYFYTFQSEAFANSNEKKLFDQGYVSLAIKGEAIIHSISSYIDCGISQADIRAVCYENGDPIFENGKIYFTASVRMQEGGFQGVFSLTPSLSNIEFIGALFFDCGDGIWRNYLASSLMYNRKTKQWYIWVSAFENQVRLAWGAFDGNPLYGVNVVDVTVMDAAGDGDGYQDFVGFRGDEDPDFYYNEEENKWYMAICRLDPNTRAYRYAFFSSNDPFTGYRYIGCGKDDASETGGSFVTVGGQRLFVCGNAFNKRANYRIYTKDSMFDAKFDFDDGGFRGWGSIIPVQIGSRMRYFWITFDRQKGSDYTWSYGNIYCFEGIL
jgi:hypothetical protein